MTDPVATRDSTSRAPRWMIGAAVMLTTVMVILDMTIVNVSLPHMMGALGATSDQITWVLTTYIVVNAIFIPMTGFFAALAGRKRLMLISISGFVVSSVLCGQADTLSEMVVFRAFQGAFGAAVIPLSQAILVDTFPAKERGKAMALALGILYQCAGRRDQHPDGYALSAQHRQSPCQRRLVGRIADGCGYRCSAAGIGSRQPG
jgi:MFS family permease